MIITLCGSTKFIEDFHHWNRKLTLAGNLVFSVSTSVKGEWKPTEEEKEQLDKIHKEKIFHSDAILVINKDNYIGESTMSEIEYAIMENKIVMYTERVPNPEEIELKLPGSGRIEHEFAEQHKPIREHPEPPIVSYDRNQ